MTDSLTAQPGKGGSERKNVALLGAFCLFLSTIEYMIPKPLPFMRLGIANLPLMLALDIFPLRTFILLVAIKIVGQAVITGTLFSYIFLFSLAGTAASAAAMYLLRRGLGPKRISFIGVGTVGAMLSNLSQILLARIFVFGESAKYIAPPFLAAGVITGVALGIFCEYFTARSQWYQQHRTLR
ncbi:Gx transporter family protein [Breznakiella homolactica]|uniref:Gx transporter family protein n=1 Tax=Breznakiella homolactica TaxID=2798577 RepID=A0A7T8BAV3_9SPIR|nr:Gx transporter family protein [Breznakiella homolactica]QQO09771.1 Gx transporter family protein [Breznakiella homolactica]